MHCMYTLSVETEMKNANIKTNQSFYTEFNFDIPSIMISLLCIYKEQFKENTNTHVQ